MAGRFAKETNKSGFCDNYIKKIFVNIYTAHNKVVLYTSRVFNNERRVNVDGSVPVKFSADSVSDVRFDNLKSIKYKISDEKMILLVVVVRAPYMPICEGIWVARAPSSGMDRKAIRVNVESAPSCDGSDCSPTSVSDNVVMFGVLLLRKKFLGICPVKPGNKFACKFSIADGLVCDKTAEMSLTMRDEVNVRLSNNEYVDRSGGTFVIRVDVSVRCVSEGANDGNAPLTREPANDTYSSDDSFETFADIVARIVSKLRKPRYEMRPTFVLEQQKPTVLAEKLKQMH